MSALCILMADGVPADEKEALKWFLKAAEQGYAEAQYNAGLMYKKGDGMLFSNKKEARRWLQAAADQGHKQAQESLRSL